MDFNKLIARIKAILTAPKTEWPVIAAESETVAGLYKNYILVLAAIPAVMGFIKSSIIGYSLFGITARASVGAGITQAVLAYALTLGLVYVVALIVDALAPSFGGQKNPVQALKTVAYSYTASWIASIATIVPAIGWLIAIAGGIYGIYLLYLGLPATMQAPREKAAGYTAVTVVLALILGWIVGLVVAGVGGTAALTGAAINAGGGSVSIDKDSPLSGLEALGKNMEAASAKLEAARKSGDADAQADAIGAVMGAALGAGGKVEALAPDQIKPFLPESLLGLPRTEISAERNGAMGMQVSEANATYSDGNRRLKVELVDVGSAKGILGMAAGFAGVERERQTANGYEKTYRRDGRLIEEKWDGNRKRGEFGIVLGNRFSVKVSGDADSIEQLKSAVTAIDLAGLERLKDHGVSKG